MSQQKKFRKIIAAKNLARGCQNFFQGECQRHGILTHVESINRKEYVPRKMYMICMCNVLTINKIITIKPLTTEQLPTSRSNSHRKEQVHKDGWSVTVMDRSTQTDSAVN